MDRSARKGRRASQWLAKQPEKGRDWMQFARNPHFHSDIDLIRPLPTPSLLDDLIRGLVQRCLNLTVSLKAWHYSHLFIFHMRNDGRKRTV